MRPDAPRGPAWPRPVHPAKTRFIGKDHTQPAATPGSRALHPPDRAGKDVFLKGMLSREITFGMKQARHQVAPAMINLRDIEVMRALRLTALAFGLATPAMAATTLPEEYQGVWAAARDCKENFQNVLSNAVNRQFAACRVMQVLNAGPPESHTNTIYLDCGGSQRREIWHDENFDGTDYLVIIQIEQRMEAGRPSIDMYKRCPEIPLSEIPLSDIPGNPVEEEKIVTTSRTTQIARQPQLPHSRATRIRKHGSR